MNQTKKDIENRSDIELLVNRFYQRVRKDALIGPIFNERIGNHWAEHLQKLYEFWDSRLLTGATYGGNPLQAHRPLPIGAQHFERWLTLWEQTVNDFFEGSKADEAIEKAHKIGSFFEKRLEEMKKGKI